jgi:hypothetical protein
VSLNAFAPIKHREGHKTFSPKAEFKLRNELFVCVQDAQPHTYIRTCTARSRAHLAEACVGLGVCGKILHRDYEFVDARLKVTEVVYVKQAKHLACLIKGAVPRFESKRCCVERDLSKAGECVSE